MKRMILAMAACTVLAAYGGNGVTKESTAKVERTQPKKEKNRVEILYFHGRQRCATCMAIERNIRDLVNSTFAKEQKEGTVVLKIVEISTPDGEKTADRYEVAWSSLFVNKWKNGKETRNNMTEFGFGNARKNPKAFKEGMIRQIRTLLK